MYYRHAHGSSLAPTLDVPREGGNLSSDICFDDFLSTLRAHPCWHIFNDEQFSFNPKVLLDSFLFHLLAADVAFAIIVFDHAITHSFIQEQQ